MVNHEASLKNFVAGAVLTEQIRRLDLKEVLEKILRAVNVSSPVHPGDILIPLRQGSHLEIQNRHHRIANQFPQGWRKGFHVNGNIGQQPLNLRFRQGERIEQPQFGQGVGSSEIIAGCDHQFDVPHSHQTPDALNGSKNAVWSLLIEAIQDKQGRMSFECGG